MAKFSIARIVERRYKRAIIKAINSLMPAKLNTQTYEQWVMDFAAVSQRNDFWHLAQQVARGMVSNVNTLNAKSWREASARNQRSRMLYGLLKKELNSSTGVHFAQVVDKNAELIRSVPEQIAAKLNKHISEAQQSGMRAGAITTLLKTQLPELTDSKVKLIARTQTAATGSILTEVRATAIGLDWAEWEGSEDQRERPSHLNMNGVLFNWSDLPDPEKLIGEKSTLGRYAPGRCPNCRCFGNPLLTLDDVKWPCRVYHAGKITRMTRAQFALLSGLPARRKSA